MPEIAIFHHPQPLCEVRLTQEARRQPCALAHIDQNTATCAAYKAASRYSIEMGKL
jgi:hypothetical protein